MKDGIGQLINLIDEVVVKYKAWGIIEQTRGGIGPGFLHSKSCLVILLNDEYLSCCMIKNLSISESSDHWIKRMSVKVQKSCMGHWNEWNRQPHNH